MGVNVKKLGIRSCAATECMFGAQDLAGYAHRSGYPELMNIAATLLNKLSMELGGASDEEMAYIDQVQRLASGGRLLKPARSFAFKEIKKFGKVLRGASATAADTKRILGFAIDGVKAQYSFDGTRTKF